MISKPSSSAIMSKAEFAYTAIRDAIQGGELTPGQRLGPRELAENLGISYTPVREALTLLEHEGLVTRQRNKGTYVRTVSRTQIEQIYSLRLLLEPKAAAEAAQHSSHGLVVKLHDFLGSEPAREDSRAITFQNQDFHMTVYAAAENPPLLNLIRQLWIGLPLQSISLRGRSADSDSEHLEIVAAISAGDADQAEAAMRAHIRDGYESLLRVLDEIEMI